MISHKEMQEIMDFALSIAAGSGRIARKYFRSSLVVDSKSEIRFDPVTEADRKIETYLCNKIKTRYPTHGIIGEENGGKKGDKFTWVIDPIDGTRGYISGSPMWGTLIGLMNDSGPVMGLMHQPFLRETFFANLKGAWWKVGTKTRKLKTTNTEEIGKAILYCTHPSMFTNKNESESFKKIESMSRYSRYGGDCYGYCLLAAGFVDLVIEADLKPYDIIPLIPIVESAGGIITNWEGNSSEYGGRVIAAANKDLHKKALSIMNS